MTLDDRDLRKLHQQATRPRSRRDCPSGETLARGAAGELAPPERLQLADHLAGCADCAEEFQLASSLKPWARTAAPERWRGPELSPFASALALAAVVIIAVAAGFWAFSEVQRARDATGVALAAAESSREEAARLRRELDEASRPQLDLVVADLYPRDSTRGAASAGEQLLSVPASARLFSVILNVAEPLPASDFGLRILEAGGRLVWEGRPLHPNRFETFTVALPRSLLPAGRYRFVLEALATGGTKVIEEYIVRVDYEQDQPDSA